MTSKIAKDFFEIGSNPEKILWKLLEISLNPEKNPGAPPQAPLGLRPRPHWGSAPDPFKNHFTLLVRDPDRGWWSCLTLSYSHNHPLRNPSIKKHRHFWELVD